MTIRKHYPFIIIAGLLLACGCGKHNAKVEEEEDEVIEKSRPSARIDSIAEEEQAAPPSANYIQISGFDDRGHLEPQAGNSYRPENLADGNQATVWAVPVSNLYAEFGPLQGPVLNLATPARIEAVEIMNGYGKSKSSFQNNTRASWIRIFRFHPEYDGEYAESQAAGIIDKKDIIYEGPLEDRMDFQRLAVSKSYDNSRPTRFIGLQFSDPDSGKGYYPGKKWNDLCISEIRVVGN